LDYLYYNIIVKKKQ